MYREREIDFNYEWIIDPISSPKNYQNASYIYKSIFINVSINYHNTILTKILNGYRMKDLVISVKLVEERKCQHISKFEMQRWMISQLWRKKGIFEDFILLFF